MIVSVKKFFFQKSPKRNFFCLFLGTKHSRMFARGHALNYPLDLPVASGISQWRDQEWNFRSQAFMTDVAVTATLLSGIYDWHGSQCVKWYSNASLALFGCHETKNCQKKQSSQFSKQFLSPFSIIIMNLGQWPKESDHKCKRLKWDFHEKSNKLCYLARCIALWFENL